MFRIKEIVRVSLISQFFFFVFVPHFLNARILLVPEDFKSLQEALLVARDGDTVSYKVPTPEFSLYEAGVYCLPLPMGEGRGEGRSTGSLYKKIHVGLRYPGWKNPWDMEMSSKEIYPKPFSTIQDSGYWAPQEMVNDSDTLVDMMGSFLQEKDSTWWYFWSGDPDYVHELEIFGRAYANGIWESEFQLSDSDTLYDGQPFPVVDTLGKLWVVWMHSYDVNPNIAHWDFWYRIKEGAFWTPTDTVLATPRNDWRGTPFLAGNKVFVSFNGDTINGQPVNYEVYSTFWDGNEFTPETVLSHPDWGYDESYDNMFGGYGDSFGRGHITWREYLTGGLFYRQWADGHWGDIVLTIDTTVYYGYQSAIGVDPNTGEIYIAFNGYIKGTGGNLDIYLIHSQDGYNWSKPFRVNEDTDYTDRFPQILVISSDNIWVFWDKETSLLNVHTHGRHYMNGNWEPEFLIPQTTEPSLIDAVFLGIDSLPRVMFDGMYGNFIDPSDVFYTYFIPTSIREVNYTIEGKLSVEAPVLIKGGSLIELKAKGLSGERGELRVYDVLGRLRQVLWRGLYPESEFLIPWDTRGIPSGRYFLYLDCKPSYRIVRGVLVIGG